MVAYFCAVRTQAATAMLRSSTVPIANDSPLRAHPLEDIKILP